MTTPARCQSDLFAAWRENDAKNKPYFHKKQGFSKGQMTICFSIILNQIALEHYVMLYLKNHNSFHFYKFNFLCVACEIAARQAKPSVGPCQFLRL